MIEIFTQENTKFMLESVKIEHNTEQSKDS